MVNAGCNRFQALWSVIDSVHGRHVGKKRLRRTDIGGRLFAFNVLFSSLQCHTQCTVSLYVDTYANDTARHVSFEIFVGGEERCMWSAKSKRHTEALGRTAGHVGT